MIISASRRTDTPAFYSAWLLRRLREGHVLAPYARNLKRQGSVRLSPGNVDCIVFWTKNPAPMLPKEMALEKMHQIYPGIRFRWTIFPFSGKLNIKKG
jgi:hypothetical protein